MSGGNEQRFTSMLAELRARPLPKRFYKEAGVSGDASQFAITLDGRPVKTPLRRELALPQRALAEAVAQEWQRQGEHIDPATMPMTRLANTALDRVAGDEPRIVAEIAEYAGSDLLCYRTQGPQALIEREARHWDPVLAWAGAHLAHPFIAVTGLVHQPQPEPTLRAVTRHLSRHDAFALTALHNMATLTGSALIAMAVEAGELQADAAWVAAHVDEDWQIEQWGEDAEATRRRQARRAEFDAAVAFLALVRHG